MQEWLMYEMPKEAEQHYDAVNGATFRAILQDLSKLLRSKRKYEDKVQIDITEVEIFIRDALQNQNLRLHY